MFASASRLDLGITVGYKRPSGVRTILSGPLPIFVEYSGVYGITDLPGYEYRNMRTAFEHHRDRVREISFKGSSADFDKFFEVTKCPFPVLESLVLNVNNVASELKPPDTFLGGPKLPDLHLRRLTIGRTLLASVSAFLSSATDLTDLTLQIDTVFGPSPETSFLAYLRGMPYLRSLNLSIPNSAPSKFLSTLTTSEDIIPLSNLTRFYYVGHPVFLSALLAGFSAPSLWDVDFSFSDSMLSPIVHLPRFISEMEGHYHIAQVTITAATTSGSANGISFSLLTHSEPNSHSKPQFKLHDPGRFPASIMQMSRALSTRLTTIEELRITFGWLVGHSVSDNVVPWLGVFRYFPCVRVLRLESPRYDYMARTLDQGHEERNDLVLLPALEEIQLCKNLHFTNEIKRAHQLVTFQPFVSAREQAGRPVKVFFRQ